MNESNIEIYEKPIVYAAKHCSEGIRAESRSGGVFTAVSDYILESGGVVYGCVLTDDFTAVHIRARTASERDKMRKSKYVQSRLDGGIFQSVKEDLNNGITVLFSGTSCQIAGLKSYLGKNYANLICLDIVCYGVPSPLVWKDYCQWEDRRNKSKIKAVEFRNKQDFGWRGSIATLEFENGEKTSSDIFYRFFYGDNINRPCCYKCPYKSVIHPGDITIGDYWGIEKAAPEFDDNKGTSLVLINNSKGKEVFEKVQKNLCFKQTALEDSMQKPLKAPVEKPAVREQFWEDYHKKSFKAILSKYCGVNFKNKFKSRIKGIIKKFHRG